MIEGTCGVCRGAQSLMSVKPLTYWDCPGCGGAGVHAVFGPPLVRSHAKDGTMYGDGAKAWFAIHPFDGAQP